MFSLRHLVRTVPRSARLSRTLFRAPIVARSAPIVPTKFVSPSQTWSAAFHLSPIRQQDGSGVTEELIAKLQSEIAVEEELKEDEDLSANIKEYLENSPFEIEDKPGHHEVFLTRTFGDETIRITLTTGDLNSNAANEELAEDNALFDDVDMETQSGGANTKGAVAQGQTSDGNIRVGTGDRVTQADREELDDDFANEPLQQGFPARAVIRVERPGKGALAIEATIQDGDILIEDIYYFPTGQLADPTNAEQDWERRSLYTGPPFNNLDEDLQIIFEKYLEERGINTRLALFIPDYIDQKEQREYVGWLNKLKHFVE